MDNAKNILKVLLVILLLGAMVVAVIWFWRIRQKAQTTPIAPIAPSAAEIEKSKQKEFNQIIDNTYQTDKDLDGLTDQEETKYGTSSTSPDTDKDGLLDGDEINIYKTNPLKADTDGDGYADGVEVRNGYNPNGAGKK